jgi:hypothetical protein
MFAIGAFVKQITKPSAKTLLILKEKFVISISSEKSPAVLLLECQIENSTPNHFQDLYLKFFLINLNR